MRNSYVSKATRIAAGVMALALLLIVLFSSLYIVAEADHECSGEACHICACIRQCEGALRRIGSAVTTQRTAVFLFAVSLFAAITVAAVVWQKTPISAKVRLND